MERRREGNTKPTEISEHVTSSGGDPIILVPVCPGFAPAAAAAAAPTAAPGAGATGHAVAAIRPAAVATVASDGPPPMVALVRCGQRRHPDSQVVRAELAAARRPGRADRRT